jgi:hypothetical protein
MKTYFKVLLTLVVLSTSVAGASIRESGGRGGATAVYVDFRSFGTGIDRTSLRVTEQMINTAIMNGEVIEKTIEQKGREGEMLICVRLTTDNARWRFIKALAPQILADRQVNPRRTAVLVWTSCGHVDVATEQDLQKY